MSVQAATTPLPQPTAISAPVTIDYANMALIVRRPEAANGYQRLLWREAHGQLVRANELGWPYGTRFIYGSAPGAYEFGYATPAENLTLVFGFTPGTPKAKVYAELLSKPGLSAFVLADKSTRLFLSVTFRHSL
jgi:hypothetical protein